MRGQPRSSITVSPVQVICPNSLSCCALTVEAKQSSAAVIDRMNTRTVFLSVSVLPLNALISRTLANSRKNPPDVMPKTIVKSFIRAFS